MAIDQNPSTSADAKAKNGGNDDDDDWEEQLVVVDLHGVLDASTISRAINTDEIALRFANTESPMVQVGSSLFSGQWRQTLGTDMIFARSPPAPAAAGEPTTRPYQLEGKSSTRLVATKLIVQHDDARAEDKQPQLSAKET